MGHMHCDAASVFLRTDNNGLTCVASAGPVNLKGFSILVGTGIVGRSVSESRVLMIRDVDDSEHFFDGIDKETGFQT